MNIPQTPRKLIQFLELPIAVFAFIFWIIASNILFALVSAMIEWRYEGFTYAFHLRIILMLVIYKLIANYIEGINFGLKKLKDRIEKGINSKMAMVPEEQREKARQFTGSLNNLLSMVFDHAKCVRYFTIAVAITIGIMLLQYFEVVG